MTKSKAYYNESNENDLDSKIEKEENQFYKRRQDKNLGSYCKCCTKLQATTRQQKVIEEAINYKGGKTSKVLQQNSYQSRNNRTIQRVCKRSKILAINQKI